MNEITYRFTPDSEICDLKKMPVLSALAPYTFGNGEKTIFKPGYTFADLQKDHPTWDAKAAADGCNRLLELTEQGVKILHDLDEKDAKLLYLPAENTLEVNRPWIILAAGGGYFGVCSLVESIPTAAHLNTLGYDVFCLNYRCGTWKLWPKPLEDLAAAVRYIRLHALRFGLNPDRYVAGGFSAGGHLIGIWGTGKGFAHYNLPKPECIWLNYPMVSAELDEKGWISAFIVKKLMFGLFSGRKKIEDWALDKQIGPGYPPTYLIMAKDDDTIPQSLYERLKSALRENHIPILVRHVETGGHGYGLGRSTEAGGWTEEAIEFWQKEKRSAL